MKERLTKAIFGNGYISHKDIIDIAYKNPNESTSLFSKIEYKDAPKSKYYELTILCLMKDGDNYVSSELSEIFTDDNESLDETELSEKIKRVEFYVCKMAISKKNKQTII